MSTGLYWLHWQETETGKRGRTVHPLSRKDAFFALLNRFTRARGDLDHWLTELTPAELAKYQAIKEAGHV